MSTSIFNGRVQAPVQITQVVYGPGDAVGSARVRDVLANGLLHFADERGQQVVNLMSLTRLRTGNPSDYVAEYLSNPDVSTTDVFLPIASLDVRHLVLPRYRWRVRVVGASGGGSEVDFLVMAMVGGVISAMSAAPALDSAFVTEAASSSSGTELDGNSNGPLALDHMLVPPPGTTHVGVWGRATVTSSPAMLFGLSIGTYVGL